MKTTGPARLSLPALLFVFIAGICRRLPAFRGRNRFVLMIHSILGLKNKHVHVIFELESPVRFKANLDIHSWLQRLAFLTGSYEAEEVTFLNRLHACQNSSGYMLDVGANIGLISIPFALMAKVQTNDALRVVAVEAVPDNFLALTENVALNGLGSSIKLIRTALGDAPGTIEIQVEGDLASGQGTGTANILPDGSEYQCVRQTLELKTMDHMSGTGELPNGCSVIKIDTDGYDLKIFQGGIKFLRKNRPVILGEFAAHCLNWHHQSIQDVVDFAKQNDYLVWQKNPGVWTFSTLIDPDTFHQDLLLVPLEDKEKFNWCLTGESP